MTSSERRVQRVRAAVPPQGDARDDVRIISDLALRMGAQWPTTSPEGLWDELRSLSPLHGGMSWERLAESGGLRWPCPDEDHPGTEFLHEWLWEPDLGGHASAPFSVVTHRPPAEVLSEQFPLRLTTGRVLDSYKHGRTVSRLFLADPIRRRDRSESRRRGRSRDCRRRSGSGELAPRFGGHGGARHRSPAHRLGVHDVPFPGSGRFESAHQRRLGRAQRDSRIQGRSGTHRPAEIRLGRRRRRIELGRRRRRIEPSRRRRRIEPSCRGRWRWWLTCSSPMRSPPHRNDER